MFALLALVVFVAAGCRVQIETKIDVGLNGKGTITQGIGFDDAALKRVGDPAQALRADDLVQAGWEVDAASKEGDLTWIRVHHSFATPEEGSALLAQLSGPDGPYRDMFITRSGGFSSTSVNVTGQIDTTAGLAMFGDQQLATTLGGDASGGLLAKIEAEEKAPPASLVGLDLIVTAGGTTKTYNASFTDTDTQKVNVGSSRDKFLQIFEALVVFGLAGLTATVIGLRYRKRRLRTRRLMHSRGRRW
ncbi:MAG: hypothetical protein NT081_10080 [Actinobacteria bacterium]|nr:hypothetical protein [Actinomycetota bacterium]